MIIRTRKKASNNDFLSSKEVEAINWDISSVYLMRLYKIIREGRDGPLILKTLTMIDP